MSWLPSWLGGSTAPPQPAPVREKSADGGYVAPDRNTREICYESRDLFYSCLDKHDILDSIKHDEEARAKCGTEMREFERDCARSWIKYFKEKRIMEYNRDATLKKIRDDDAAMVKKQKAQGKQGGWFQ